MTRIDFYLNAESKSRVVYRICLKVIESRTNLDIFCPEADIAASLDRFLWTASSIGFVPHSLVKIGQNRIAPIAIVSEIGTQCGAATLVNLAQSVPPEFNRYDRLVEIVSSGDEDDKSNARTKYRFYKSRGYVMNHHDLSSLAQQNH